MFSIYHFFAHLLVTKDRLLDKVPLEQFPFDAGMLSCQNKAKFPDMAIRLSPPNPDFTGGELIELKDSQSYGIPSFNSTIPTGTKAIGKVVLNEQSTIYRLMTAAGDNVFSLPIRKVFYLLRGRRGNDTKVCLIHGSFFETVKVEALLRQAFSQVIDERIASGDFQISEETKKAFVELFSDQAGFSKVRDVENASVKLRFRVMTEAKAEGNIFNSSKYPEIRDNTLNLLLPIETDDEESQERHRMELALGEFFPDVTSLRLKHPLNGYFLVFQASL